jgi:sec-independent protein translocase protein TatB
MFPEGRILDFLIVGVVALIVVGPKDLPILMRKVGRFMARMRGMAAEFRASFDEMARQSELDELRREVEALRTGQPLKAAAGLEGEGGIQAVFDDIHATLRETPAQIHPTSPQGTSGPEAPEPAALPAPETESAQRAAPEAESAPASGPASAVRADP